MRRSLDKGAFAFAFAMGLDGTPLSAERLVYSTVLVLVGFIVAALMIAKLLNAKVSVGQERAQMRTVQKGVREFLRRQGSTWICS